MTYRTVDFSFSPLGYAQGDDVIYLSTLLHTQNVASSFQLRAHRRRGAWGSTVPVGAFDNDYRPDACTWAQHVVSRDRVTKLAAAGAARRRRPIARRHDVLEHEGALYYHPEALRVYARFVEHPAFFIALARFLEAADKDPQLIAPKRHVPFVPFDQREATFGKVVRGPAWTPTEDNVLRRWFGQRTIGPKAGHHVKLTEAEWDRVIAELPQRNRNGVRNRLVELNKQLQHEFFRDGFVARDRLPQYMARVLGERPRIPIRPTKRRRR